MQPKYLFTVLLLIAKFVNAQDSSTLAPAIQLPGKAFAVLTKKTSRIQENLGKKTDKYLSKIEKQENILRKKLWKKDSILAKQIFDEKNQRLTRLDKFSKSGTQLVNKCQQLYSGHLDSLTTALNFLKTRDVSGANLSCSPEIRRCLLQYQQLQQTLNTSDQIRRYLEQRQQLLKEQFESLGMVKQVQKYREEVYYYQAQMKEYKQEFENPNEIEERLLSLTQKIPQFKSFFEKNSLLGNMFALPDRGATGPLNSTSLAGLQTRATVNQIIATRFGNTANVNQQLQQNVNKTQLQFGQLKNKILPPSSGSYGNSSSAVNMPDQFKSNSQKTKSFRQRIELGMNIQSQRARYFFPVSSNIAFSAGYRLNDKSVVGLGISYRVGWGKSWSNFTVSSMGLGLRSFIESQIKGSIYFSGGYEQNYQSLIKKISDLKDYSAWQSSGLIGFRKISAAQHLAG